MSKKNIRDTFEQLSTQAQVKHAAKDNPTVATVVFQTVNLEIIRGQVFSLRQLHQKGLENPSQMQQGTYIRLHHFYKRLMAKPEGERDESIINEVKRLMEASPFIFVEGRGVVEMSLST